MKIPISWLREYVDFDATPEELGARLTFSGIELEGIHSVGSTYDGIIVGEVAHVAPHPGADRLKLCRVNNGVEEVGVVCGADNYKVGDKVPFIPAGCVLPDGTKIKKAKIRGEQSCGMMCAEDELGLSADHSGIMILDSGLAPGTPFSEVMGPPETVLELEVTWNRPDCLSIIGVAREVAALYGTTLKKPAVDLVESDFAAQDAARIIVEDTEGCPRYTARVLRDLKPGPSPLWMQRRLEHCGIRPISNIVDITNYVLLECGQPLHAFDYDRLARGKDIAEVTVRRARSGEKMITLDGLERELDSEMLLITDAGQPVALAGVMGGAGSEIVDETNMVLLESACFCPSSIHLVSSRLGLSTESSHRFERGVDISSVEWASARAAALLVEHAGAKVDKGVIDIYPVPVEPRYVRCRGNRVRNLLGVDVGNEEIVSILESLQIAVVDVDGDDFSAVAPVFRRDLEIEADIIEEIVRMYGLDRIPDIVPRAMIVPSAEDNVSRAFHVCRTNLVGLGLSEIMNYSFVSDTLLSVFGADDGSRVRIPNPVSKEHDMLRNSLLPQMVEALGRNSFHQVESARLFEIGRVFFRGGEPAIGEEDRLSIGLMGDVGQSGICLKGTESPERMYLAAKGILEAIFISLHVGDYGFQPVDKLYIQDGTGVSVSINGHICGVMGLLSDKIRSDWRMTGPVAVAEIAIRLLIRAVYERPDIAEVPVYPGISRDMALLVKEHVTHEEIMKVVRKHAPSELTDVKLFDIYTGEGVASGMKSLAYTLVYRSLERTLTDEDANGHHEMLKEALKNELNVEIR